MAGEDQPKLFDRIDASKLQGALSNASMMGRLEVRPHVHVVSGCVGGPGGGVRIICTV